MATIVWSYQSFLGDDFIPYHRIICFKYGSLLYSGKYLKCSDSIWIVPNTIMEE